MNRASFLKKGISVITIMSIPRLAFAQFYKPKSQLFQLPEPKKQIRHGFFEQKLIKSLHLDQSIIEVYEPLQMFANGYSPSKNDLFTYLIKINGNALSLHIENDTIFISTNEYTETEIKINTSENNSYSIQKRLSLNFYSKLKHLKNNKAYLELNRFCFIEIEELR